jgi:hypothetical protein
MKDPVSGVFKVADWYDRHPSSTPSGTTLTGVLVADGIPPTPAEVPVDHHGKWVGQQELPVTVDRADPSNFRVEWDQVVQNDWRSTARQRAAEAATRMAAGDQRQPPVGATTGAFATDFNMDFSPMVDDVLRAVGINPADVHVTREVHVETGFGTGAEPATGVVRAVHDVVPAVPLPPGMSQADLTLDVTRPDGTTYPVTTRIGFRSPARRAAVATVGTRLPVLVDPANPGRVVIDVARLNLP